MKKKTVFIVLGCVAAVIVAIVGVAFYATSGMTGAADKFFETARGGEQAEIYALTSAELRNATSAEQLAGFIKANRFDQVAETSWSSRSIENGLGSLEGSLTLDDGGVIPLSVQLVKEGGDWKVSFIELREAGLRGGAGLQTGGGDTGVPPENVVLNLVRYHTGVFFDAARREDAEYFRESWAGGIALAELERLTASMEGADEAIELLEQARPIVDQAVPTEGGGFEAAGHIPAEPWRYQYAYTFVPVGETWKLTDFRYELQERN